MASGFPALVWTTLLLWQLLFFNSQGNLKLKKSGRVSAAVDLKVCWDRPSPLALLCYCRHHHHQIIVIVVFIIFIMVIKSLSSSSSSWSSNHYHDYRLHNHHHHQIIVIVIFVIIVIIIIIIIVIVIIIVFVITITIRSLSLSSLTFSLFSFHLHSLAKSLIFVPFLFPAVQSRKDVTGSSKQMKVLTVYPVLDSDSAAVLTHVTHTCVCLLMYTRVTLVRVPTHTDIWNLFTKYDYL